MARDRSKAEVRGIIASKQGLSCEGYYILNSRTAHLRERLYVTVRDGGKLFLPQGNEHFPCGEIEEFYVRRMHLGFYRSVGAGGGEIVFSCEGADATAAEEGAEAIANALPEVVAAANQPLLLRWGTSVPEKLGYLRTVQGEARPAYRPERLPERAGPPEPRIEGQVKDYDPEQRDRALAAFEAKKREALAKWGLLKDYDRAQAQRRAEAQRQAARNPWEAPSWRQTTWNFNRQF